jgi:hypothetical protein
MRNPADNLIRDIRMRENKGELVCELTGEQFEAALNVAKFLSDERAAGRPIALNGIRGFRIYRGELNRRQLVIEAVGTAQD